MIVNSQSLAPRCIELIYLQPAAVDGERKYHLVVHVCIEFGDDRAPHHSGLHLFTGSEERISGFSINHYLKLRTLQSSARFHIVENPTPVDGGRR